MIDGTISHYRLTAKLGQGGMGEVYRATDTKLDREVAIKVLPKSFAEDATRLARFEREAKVLAALNHPNIAVIYGIEQSVETQALIMELVEGETLGERLQRERMTVPEALDCCKQIAEALEAAHEKGIIHRDLKPENVKITPDGRVKVLDFGLAKALADPSSSSAAELNQADSPTVTNLSTVPGQLLGTAPYMSPEQARARPVDKRSDIWSFGCVLYECLTSRPMFSGEDVTETLASIIKDEPDWDALPEDTPPTIELLLHKCLNKDRKRRLRDIGDACIDIEQALGISNNSIMGLSGVTSQKTKAGTGVPHLVTVGLVLAAILVAAVLLGLWWLRRYAVSPAAFRFGKSVAVIPFKVKSEDMVFFADGLCEELTNALGRVEQFDKIPPWSSSSTFRQDTPDKRMIAEEMEVSTLLEGSIQRADDQLRISATLVDPFRGRSGAVIWSATYDHSHTTSLPFAIQDRIVRSIVEGLRIKLEDDPDRQFVQRYTQSPEAYDCYLKGRYAVKQRGVALEKAKSWFELALLYDSPTGSLDDSAMAPAYVGLADTYILQGFYGLAPIRPAIEKARRYLERALQIDERLAEAYATLGFTELMACNAAEAAEAFGRALQLNDRYVPAIQWYSSYFNAIGSYGEAVDLARQAIEVDTASYFTQAVSAWQLAFYFPKETIAVVNEVLQHQPDFALAHFIKAFALINTQQPEAAIESIQAAVELSGGFAFYQSTLALAYARAGKKNEALQTLEDLQGTTTTGPWQFACMAAAFLELGDKERCYAVLEQCLAETYGFPWLTTPGFLDALHDEPRFIDIVNRTGLLKYNPTTRQFEVNNEPLKRKVDH